jgi:hypothetical protein
VEAVDGGRQVSGRAPLESVGYREPVGRGAARGRKFLYARRSLHRRTNRIRHNRSSWRLAAASTVVNNTFVPRLEADMLAEHANKRIIRLDGKGEDHVPVDTGTWSPSGAGIE